MLVESIGDFDIRSYPVFVKLRTPKRHQHLARHGAAGINVLDIQGGAVGSAIVASRGLDEHVFEEATPQNVAVGGAV